MQMFHKNRKTHKTHLSLVCKCQQLDTGLQSISTVLGTASSPPIERYSTNFDYLSVSIK